MTTSLQYYLANFTKTTKGIDVSDAILVKCENGTELQIGVRFNFSTPTHVGRRLLTYKFIDIYES